MTYEIGKIYGTGEYTWQVVGYLCTGDGIQAVGNYLTGREAREWEGSFNNNETQVRKTIETLPISQEAKSILAKKGVYPENLLDVVGVTHNNWRRSKGLSPDYHFAKMVRGGRPLKGVIQE